MAQKKTSGKMLSIAIASSAVAGGLGALGYLRYFFQPRRLFLPERLAAAEAGRVLDPSRHGLPVEDLTFAAADGVSLHAWWMPHPHGRGVLLYCHGQTGNLTHQVPYLRFLRRLRLHLLAFDYRGYGRSGGEPSERGLYLDVRAAFDHLVGPLGRRPEEILLLGHSLGGAVAVDCALDRPVAGLVVQASFTDVRDAARASFPGLHFAARNQFRSIDKVGRLRMPKLFVHGSADAKVPLSHAERLFAAAAEPKELYIIPRGGHNELYLKGGMRYLWRLARFREACLSDTPA